MSSGEAEYNEVNRLERSFTPKMSTIDAVKYCDMRFGIPCNEAKLVAMNIVFDGVVDKEDIKKYARWYKNTHLKKYSSNYPFVHVDEKGNFYKDGYTMK